MPRVCDVSHAIYALWEMPGHCFYRLVLLGPSAAREGRLHPPNVEQSLLIAHNFLHETS
jgi:hypothetical protein